MSEEDIDFLISIQDLEQPEFDNACLERENERLHQENKQLKSILTEFKKTLNSYDLEYLHTMNEHLLADNIENLKDILQKLEEKYK